jgi:UMF1 family MFS transporter
VTEAPAARPARSAAALIGWCSYDWANSAFAAIIVTFVFPFYFSEMVAGSGPEGAADWGVALGISGVAVALTAPLVGAVADRSGRLKPWLAVLTFAAALFTVGLWFVRPMESDVLLALVLVALANVAVELATVFYNALLPRLAPPHLIGRLSGWGWAAGYAGGLAALVLCLTLLIQANPPPAFLDVSTAEPVRATAVLTGLWLLVFSLPLFLFVAEPRGPGMPMAQAIAGGWTELKSTLRKAWSHGMLLRFLIARMLYIDGLAALFAFGGIFAAQRFGFGIDEVLKLGILLNVTGALGAAAFGWIDDRIGPKPTILSALAGLILLGVAALVVADKATFWIIAGALGLFVGPAQSASRSLMARIAPPGLEAEMFGLFALSGKATAFLAPFAFSTATALAGDIRAGMATIIAFLAAGFVVLWPLKAPGSASVSG